MGKRTIQILRVVATVFLSISLGVAVVGVFPLYATEMWLFFIVSGFLISAFLLLSGN